MKQSPYLLSALAAFTLIPAYAQGPLTPPAGPVVPSMKTLDQIEPRTPISATNTPGDAQSSFIISVPGSYYLTGKITGEVGKNGILITASGVTIDLGGFSLEGVPGSLAGILAGSNTNVLSGLAVSNGRIASWGSQGVNGFYHDRAQYERLRLEKNGGGGLYAGFGSTVVNCIANENTGDGLYAKQCSTITACTAQLNTTTGITTGGRSTITGCTANLNTTFGIYSNDDSTVTGSTASGNLGYGLHVGNANTISMCAASGNVLGGIYINGQYCLIDRCTASFNRNFGMSVPFGSGTRFSGCVANVNGDFGVPAASGIGIQAGPSATVENCIANKNKTHGIEVSSAGLVTGNNCRENGAQGDGAGIYTTGADNRIDGNHVTLNDRGIQCSAGGSIVLRNTASGNTGPPQSGGATADYDFSNANTSYGPVVDKPSGVLTAAGFEAHPWANFRF